MPTTFIAQNGIEIHRSTRIQILHCGAARGRHPRHRHGRRHGGRRARGGRRSRK